MDYEEFLNQAVKQEETIKSLKNHIKRLRSQIYSMTKPLSENLGVQTSGGGDTWEDKTCEIADEEKRINKKILDKYKLAGQILEVIELLDDDVLRALLIYKYVSCMSWDEIEIEMQYNYDYLRGALHRKAKAAFKKVYERIKDNT